MIALLWLLACGGAGEQPGGLAQGPGGPPGGQPGGAPGAPQEGQEGQPEAPPEPVVGGASDPVTFQGKGLEGLRVGRSSPWLLVDLVGEVGWTWWNRDTGAMGEALEGPGELVTLARDGTAWWLEGGKLFHAPAGGALEGKPTKVALEGVTSLATSVSGELMLLRAPETSQVLRLDSGEIVWSHEGPATAVGWAGDRAIVVESSVYEVKPAKGDKAELGPLPEIASASWRVGPGGLLVAEHEGMVTLVSPALLAADGVSHPIVTLPEGATDIVFLDERRWLALGPESLWLFDGDRGLPLSGDLVDSEEGWERAQLSNSPEAPRPPTPAPPKPQEGGPPGGPQGQQGGPPGGPGGAPPPEGSPGGAPPPDN